MKNIILLIVAIPLMGISQTNLNLSYLDEFNSKSITSNDFTNNSNQDIDNINKIRLIDSSYSYKYVSDFDSIVESRTFFEYNGEGKIFILILDTTLKYEYRYNANNAIEEMETFIWIQGSWRKSILIEYVYNAIGKETLSTFYNWDAIQYSEFFALETTYDSIFNKDYSIRYGWNPMSNEWNIIEKYDYTNNHDNSILTVKYDWERYLQEWIPIYKYEDIYDENKNLTIESVYYLDTALNQWNKDSKIENSYNNFGKLISTTYYSWDKTNNSWLFGTKYEVIFDEYENKSIEIFYKWNPIAENWTFNSKIYNYYSYHSLTGIVSSPNLVNLKVYPNPVLNELYVETRNTCFNYCRIFNNLGHLVKESYIKQGFNSIDMSNLKMGLYYVQVQRGKEKMVKLIVKK